MVLPCYLVLRFLYEKSLPIEEGREQNEATHGQRVGRRHFDQEADGIHSDDQGLDH